MATIYGDNTILDDLRAELKQQMDNLLAAMVAGSVSPRPAAVYNTHEYAKMILPAVSIGIGDISTRGMESGRSAGVGSQITETYEIRTTIRVHSDWRGGYLDQITVTRLLNSISNWITSHRHLTSTGFNWLEIEGADPNREFTESLTIGGELTLRVCFALSHAQA